MHRSPILLLLLVLLLLGDVPAGVWAQVQVQRIDFSSVRPSWLETRDIWSGVGQDSQGRIYVGIGSTNAPDFDGSYSVDVGLYRYTPDTGLQEFLGSLRQTSAQQGNVRSDDIFAKVHTDITELNGVMYFVSTPYHHPPPPTGRGSHVFAYDTHAGTLTDLSADEPTGVTAPEDGIVTMDLVPNAHMLVGMTHPGGSLVLFDLLTHHSTLYPAPVSWANITRQLITNPNNEVYFSYVPGFPDPGSALWAIAVPSGVMRQTQVVLRDSTIQQSQRSRDGHTVYIVDEAGNYYKFDTATEQLTWLGDGAGYTILMANDEQTLFYLAGGPSTPQTLMAYHLDTGQITAIQDVADDFQNPEVTGGIVDPQGRLFVGGNWYDGRGTAGLFEMTQVPGSPPLSVPEPGTPLPTPCVPTEFQVLLSP